MHFISVLVFLIGVQGQRSARSGISPARHGVTTSDDSIILDNTVEINGLTLRYKIAAPQSAILRDGQRNDNGQKLGLNVLLHGDGGASFEAMPNRNIQGNLMGIVVLAPNEALLWGGQSTRQVQRPDGVAHATAVNKLIQDELPKVVDFDMSNVWFTGVSGGSLLLSGFFVPMFMSRYKTGAMFLCGGLIPPAGRGTSTLNAETINTMRIHWQSSQAELSSLKIQIPSAIRYYESLARQNGSINTLQTADATPTGTHCAFDNRGFNSGIQLVMNSWTAVMSNRNGDASIKDIGVAKSVTNRSQLFNY